MPEKNELIRVPRYTFRLYDVVCQAEEIATVQVEVHSTSQTWPEVLEDFLRGLLAMGYYVTREKMEEVLPGMLDEVLPHKEE